jgi:beta-lactamase class A
VSIDADLTEVPGTVSVWYGPLGGPPTYARLPDEPHYAASTMKVAVLAAVYREVSDVDILVEVRNEFRSALAGAPAFGNRRNYDGDEAVWERLGGTASLRWLARRMIVRSSNLATNLCLSTVGLDAVSAVWRDAGARCSVVGRCIEDRAAREAGIANLVSAADLAALLSAIALGAIAEPERCHEMIDVLLAQEMVEDLAAGLPPGTRIAHKNGWVTGVRHGAGVVFPDDAPPYAVVCCTSTALPDDQARRLVARVAAASWADRHATA